MSELSTSNVKASVPANPPQVVKQNRPPVSADTQKKEQNAPASAEIDLEAAARELKELTAQHPTNLDFTVHEKTGRTVIRVIDTDTSKVVREIPPEDVLDMFANIEEMAGQLFSTKA